MLTIRRMAALIEVTCSECLELVKVRAERVTLLAVTSSEGRFWFPCPRCGRTASKHADRVVIGRLRLGRVRETSLPVRRIPPGPALTEDDLIAFGLELESAVSTLPSMTRN